MRSASKTTLPDAEFVLVNPDSKKLDPGKLDPAGCKKFRKGSKKLFVSS
jgi:hypothetical protein